MSNEYYLKLLIFSAKFSLPRRIRFIHFYFQIVEKFQHVQTFQLIEINLENFSFLLLHYNLSILRLRIQLNAMPV